MSFDPYEKLAEYHTSTIRAMIEGIRTLPHRSESPIEEILWTGLKLGFFLIGAGTGKREYVDRFLSRITYNLHGVAFVDIEPQKKIDAYRVDFLCTVRRDGSDKFFTLVVECDGHDFHERTKEQAARDRSRDRDLTLAGHTVMRFTGSEIYRDPGACCAQISSWLWDRAKELA